MNPFELPTLQESLRENPQPQQDASEAEGRVPLKDLWELLKRNAVVVLVVCGLLGLFGFNVLQEHNSFAILSGSETLDATSQISEGKTPAAEDTNAQTEGESAAGEGSEAASSGGSTEPCVVYVTGAVASPGLFTLTASARIGDAIEAAGGFTKGAATTTVNLAEFVTDGMHIHIYTTKELADNKVTVVPPPPSSTTSGGSGANAGSGAASAGSNTGGAAAAQGKVNINTADATTLQTLNGIGPALSQRIIDYRTAHGAFSKKEDIKNVSGIGDKKYEAIAEYITV
ncbi:MAG: ComEA family DNA-binding protein [Coriobacteriia bacterium]|nr:ComEA family DNA-binding protein [Coriobacteriia bacterium]